MQNANGATDTIASRTYGSFEWATRNPQAIFDDLRKLGRKDATGKVGKVKVQINHPRDSILGYFDQYGLSQCDVGEPDCTQLEPRGVTNALLKPDDALGEGGSRPGRHPEFNKQNFSFDFDALEVFNGKRFDFLHTFRVPPVDVSKCTSTATRENPCVLVDGPGDSLVPTIVNPQSCCAVSAGSVVHDPKNKKCRDGGKTCGCDADTFAFQLEPGVNTCDVGGVSFPGVIEDWENLLLTGKHVIGTANSDSHEPEKEEPGVPRTYIASPSDEPANLTPDVINTAFDKGDVLMTNGPFVRVTATGTNTVGLGGTVTAKDGKVHLSVSVDSAPWIVPTELHVYVCALSTCELTDSKPVDGAGKHVLELDVATPNEGFLLVEVTGTASEFPSVYPNEVPPLQFTDVIGALGSSFGVASKADALKPTQIVVTSPYALTNPVWVDVDGDGKVTPGLGLPDPAHASTHRDRPQIGSVMKAIDVPWAMTEDEATEARWSQVPLRKRLALSRLPRWLWPSDDGRDVRRVLLQFIAHAD